MPKISSDAQKLAQALQDTDFAVIDFETSGVRPRLDEAAGLGVFLPTLDRRFYINVGHAAESPKVTKSTPAQLVEAITAFLANPQNTIVAHNATFELRFLFRLGMSPANIQCRVSDTLIWTHRCDENLQYFGLEPTTFDTPLTYGLKELTRAFFNESPTSITTATGGKNVLFADPWEVAKYCICDCQNTFRLYERAQRLIEKNPALKKLIEEIDDPNNLVLAKLMWIGVEVDVDEAERQRAKYEGLIQECRDRIWKATHTTSAIDRPSDVLKFLRGLGYADADGFDPFTEEFTEDSNGNRTTLNKPSLKREYLLDVFEKCGDTNKQLVISLFLTKWQMEQRISAFLKPMPERVALTNGRLFPDRFSSTLTSTRFSSTPNVQNLPGRADKIDEINLEPWQELLPEHLQEPEQTRDIFCARTGYKLFSADLSAAEPRYLALIFQNALKDRGAEYEKRLQRRRNECQQRWPELHTVMQSLQNIDGDPPESLKAEWPEYDADPLYNAFLEGKDPYNELLTAMMPNEHHEAVDKSEWLENERWRGKKAFLALAYGSQAYTLSKPLLWTVERTQQALDSLLNVYKTLKPLLILTELEIRRTGEVRSLWDRPRRINGYYQLTHAEPLTIAFHRKVRGKYQNYEARIIPLGTFKYGIMAFIDDCYHVRPDGTRGRTILQGNRNGTVRSRDNTDPFVTSKQFNQIPFRNVPYSEIVWAETINSDGSRGLRHHLPRMNRAVRQGFNARCQMTGADHLRWLMNRTDEMIIGSDQFSNCRLVLTVHDSLVFEVPNSQVQDFANAIYPLLTARPTWSDIDFKVSMECGETFGAMTKIKADSPLE